MKVPTLLLPTLYSLDCLEKLSEKGLEEPLEPSLLAPRAAK